VINRFKWILTCAATLAAHTETVYRSGPTVMLRGTLQAGQEVSILGVNGDVVAEPSSSGQLEIVAVRLSEGGSHVEVRLAVEDHAGGTRVAAVESQDVNAKVSFHVRVPQGVRFRGTTRNGRILARGLAAGVEAHTINGDIDIESRDSGRATTVNGSITARLGKGADLESVNGSVRLAVPKTARLQLDVRTVNGAITTRVASPITSGIPFTRFSRFKHSHLYGMSPPACALRTVNGNITLEYSL